MYERYGFEMYLEYRLQIKMNCPFKMKSTEGIEIY